MYIYVCARCLGDNGQLQPRLNLYNLGWVGCDTEMFHGSKVFFNYDNLTQYDKVREEAREVRKNPVLRTRVFHLQGKLRAKTRVVLL